ncbi:MAG: hypothetical protein ACRDCE_15505 [Cetobacterium sp.]|uniref:hypothetical protein n=1 Tax=Cetobacterium sp. TaxID=2071632 RepID=UPI003EE71B09
MFKYWSKVIGGLLLSSFVFVGSFAFNVGGVWLEVFGCLLSLAITVVFVQWAEWARFEEEAQTATKTQPNPIVKTD